MQGNWRVGSLWGIPLFLDPSWFFILVLVTIINAPTFYARFGLALALSIGFIIALLLFSSVVLHGLGQSVAALSQGIKVNSITLFLFGGVASIERESRTPGEAFQLAIAGSVVNLVLSGLFYGLTQVLPSDTVGYAIASSLGRFNLVFTLFNLIPGFPFDGGQVLKALVWKVTGNRFKGGLWAARTGKLFGGLVIALGLALVFFRNQPIALWLAFMGGVVFRKANAYEPLARLQQVLFELTAADVMTREFRVVDANQTLRSFAEEYILADLQTPMPYYAASEGRYRGLVLIEDLQVIERNLWKTQTLESIVRPLSEITTVEEKTPLVETINTLEVRQVNHLTVLSPDQTVAGVIDRGDIVRTVAKKLNLQIPESEIQRIKAERSYPPGLQLGAVAKFTINYYY